MNLDPFLCLCRRPESCVSKGLLRIMCVVMRLAVEGWSGRLSTAFWSVVDSSLGSVRRGALSDLIAAFIWFRGATNETKILIAKKKRKQPEE